MADSDLIWDADVEKFANGDDEPAEEPTNCLWPHKAIAHLYGVFPCALVDLPQKCSCGAIFEYADEVTFHPADFSEAKPKVFNEVFYDFKLYKGTAMTLTKATGDISANPRQHRPFVDCSCCPIEEETVSAVGTGPNDALPAKHGELGVGALKITHEIGEAIRQTGVTDVEKWIQDVLQVHSERVVYGPKYTVPSKFKYLPLAELINQGYLQELNRQCLHLLGLELLVLTNGSNTHLVVRDGRDEEGGITFGFDMDSDTVCEKARKVAAQREGAIPTRLQMHGYNVQPVGR